MLAAGIILAIMIIPIIASITREVLVAVPRHQREAVLALGATRWEMVRMGVLRNGRAGILGAVILGLGRAMGETMAVTMVIGNRPQIAKSLFAPAYTMASVIANEFTEATGNLYLSALVEIGLVLLLLTVLVNGLARLLIWSITAARLRECDGEDQSTRFLVALYGEYTICRRSWSGGCYGADSTIRDSFLPCH